MVHNAIKTRFGESAEMLERWDELRKRLNEFSNLRNQIAHLMAVTRGTLDPNAKSNARLVPPFWKSDPHVIKEFDNLGYSLDELWYALGPYWGYHPRIDRSDVPGESLGYRLQQFSKSLEPPLDLPRRPPAL